MKSPAKSLNGSSAARHQLELVAGALGWTSVELERQRALLAAAWAKSAPLTARATFQARLSAWSLTALEKNPAPIESPRLAALAAVAAIVREAASSEDALARSLQALQGAIKYESALQLFPRLREVG